MFDRLVNSNCSVRAEVTHSFLVFFLLALPFPSLAEADCPDTSPTQPVEAVVSIEGLNGSGSMDGCGQYVIGWEEEYVQESNFRDVLIQQYLADGTAITVEPQIVSTDQPTAGAVVHDSTSVAMSVNGFVRTAWIGQSDDYHWRNSTALHTDFEFGQEPDPQSVPPHPGGIVPNNPQFDPSAGRADTGSGLHAWIDSQGDPEGVVYGDFWDESSSVEPCGTYCFFGTWRPCMAMRPNDGVYAITWAAAESDEEFPKFNIALRVYSATGEVLAELTGPNPDDPWVNNPPLEDEDPQFPTEQASPAVSFVGDDIVVTWAGPDIAYCQGASVFHVFARRLKLVHTTQPETWSLRDPDPLSEGRPGIFVVDTDTDGEVFTPDAAHPSVALSLAGNGKFIVAWNARHNTGRDEVRAQYFNALGQPRGNVFRVNQASGVTGPGSYNVRAMARSGAHTLSYGAQEQVLCVWSPKPYPYDEGVSYTLLPPDHVLTTLSACAYCTAHPGECDPCFKGDVNGDCALNGLDIQPFVDLLLGGPTCLSIVNICSADMNYDGAVTIDDIPCYVTRLLTEVNPCEPNYATYQQGFPDCNTNGVSDIIDIFSETSLDCNHNDVPDECDLDEGDPDGNELVSADVNSNSIPDECEPDCNHNDIPDAWDISQSTSDDVNTNGVPDECEIDCNHNSVPDDWDIAQETSADCNANGKPDECEADCNTNGVPDDCDIDPEDPDGDEWVSADCNGNGWPDECDLALPGGWGSLDCNTNGIPDECDIASCEGDPACGDCNENGIPDACDITAQISEDANTNGIPDECEGEGMMGGGSQMMMSGEGGENDQEAAWEAFYEWSAEQCWGPSCEDPTDVQFAAMVAKLQELGLPVTGRPMGP